MQFSANLGFLWSDRPFLDRIAAAKAAGFPLVEFHHDAQDEDVDAVKAALGDTKVVGLNVRRAETSGVAAIPGMEETAKAHIAEAIATARAIGAGAVHILGGTTDDAGAEERYIARLREAAETAPELTFLLEPICPQAIPGYFVSTLEQGASLLERAGVSNAKLMFDCFHVQGAGGDVLGRFRSHLPMIGHVQIAGGHTRNEPDIGELNYAYLLPAFRDAGYDGSFGCEYRPIGTVEEGLGWRDAFV